MTYGDPEAIRLVELWLEAAHNGTLIRLDSCGCAILRGGNRKQCDGHVLADIFDHARYSYSRRHWPTPYAVKWQAKERAS